MEMEEDSGFCEAEPEVNTGTEMRETIRYSRDEMLEIWYGMTEIYYSEAEKVLAGLEPLAQELYELEVGHNNHKPRHKTIDRRQRGSKARASDTGSGGRHVGDVIPFEVGVNLGSGISICSQSIFLQPNPEVYEDDSEDEVESFQPIAFSVEGEPDFESGEPQDGWEYLRRVKWEYARCPKVKVAKIDPRKLVAEQTPYMPSLPSVQPCAPELLPSKEWETEFLADFSNLRMTYSKTISENGTYDGALPSIHNQAGWENFCFGSVTSPMDEDSISSTGDESESMGTAMVASVHAEMDEDPEYVIVNDGDSMADISALAMGATSPDELHFIHETQQKETEGTKESIQMDTASPDQEPFSIHEPDTQTQQQETEETIGSLRMDTASPIEELQSLEEPDVETQQNATEETIVSMHHTKKDTKNSAKGKNVNSSSDLKGPKPPLLGILMKLDEVKRASLLRYHISWLERVDGLPEERAQWLFALSVVVDKPLDAQTSAAYRALLRRCAYLRANKTSAEDEELHRLNLLVTIAGRYFGQAEDLLS